MIRNPSAKQCDWISHARPAPFPSLLFLFPDPTPTPLPFEQTPPFKFMTELIPGGIDNRQSLSPI